MSDYQNVPEINALFVEQEDIQKALDVLDDNGTITSFSVGPTDESVDSNTVVTITTIDPAEELLIAARAQLIARFNAINLELNALGVVNLPPDKVMIRAEQIEPEPLQGEPV